MTPEQRAVTEHWVQVFEESEIEQQTYMHTHPEEMKDGGRRRLLQAQYDALLSMAKDLRRQLDSVVY